MNESSDIKTSEAEYIDNINVGGAPSLPPPPPPSPPPSPPPPKPGYTPPLKNNLKVEINKRKKERKLNENTREFQKLKNKKNLGDKLSNEQKKK